MDKKEQKTGTFLQEILRRQVFGASAAYIVVSWVIIQVLDVLAPAFNAPDWTIRAATTVLILAFPLVIVLAWEFDASRKGVTRTRDDRDTGITATHWFRRTVVGLISLVSLGSIWWVWSSGVLVDTTFADKDENKFPKIIAVDGFQTYAGEASAWLGDGVANLVRDNLSQSQYLRVVSLRRWRAISEGLTGDELLEAAASAGVRYLVQGEIIGNRKGFVLTVRLTDTRDGEQLDAKTFEVEEDASLLDRATSIAQNTRAYLKVPLQERVDVFAADFAAENPGAYRAFVGALDYWINYDFTEAKRLLRAALELQPDFVMARYYLAWVLAVEDRSDDAAKVLQAAAGAQDISERDRQYITALASALARDARAGVRVYGELVSKYPNDTEARHLLAVMHELQGDYEAAAKEYESLAKLEPEVHVGWSGLGSMKVVLGKYAEARPAIERFAKLAPDNPNVYVLRGDLNRAEGELAAAAADYRTAIEKGPDLQEAVVSLARVQYLMGEAGQALATLDGLIRDETAVPRYRIEAAFDAGGILNSMGRFRENIAYLDLIDAELRASEFFLAKALVEKAYARMQIEPAGPAIAALIDAAIQAAPGVPTRYLFVRGLYELKQADFSAAGMTAEEIRGHALPPEDPDRTEDLAAEYLLGKLALQQGQTDRALAHLEKAHNGEGYRYRIYELALAEALLAKGRTERALSHLQGLIGHRDKSDPRLDLELDRQMGRLLLAAQVRLQGDHAKAAQLAGELRRYWADADPAFAGAVALDALEAR